MPPDVRDWLAEDHLAWFVIDAVAEMDLDAFYVAYRHDGRSRPAYDPAMMVALLLYAFARGIRSSRQIERAVRRTSRCGCSRRSSVPITRRSRGLWNATRTRSPACSVRSCAVREAGAWSNVGVIAVDGTKVRGQRQSQRERRLRADRARDPRGSPSGRRGRGRALWRRARRRIARAAAHWRRPPRVAARGQAPARGAAREGGAAGCAQSRQAPQEAKRRLEEELWTRAARQPRL